MNVRSNNRQPGGRRKSARTAGGTSLAPAAARVVDTRTARRRPIAPSASSRGQSPGLVDSQLERTGGTGASDAPKRGRGRPLVDDKRRRILDAALATFAARGYHGTSVPEVAAAAGVGVGTLYRYFADKNALVNELYRDAKLRLRAALLDGLPSPDVYQLDSAHAWFAELWRRLAAFARAEPAAFRFLEMQDHVEYLDAESRELELSVLAPLWLAGKRLRDRSGGPPVDVAIALLWGAFVGLVKANRLGYLALDDRKLEQAGVAAWRMIAPELSRAAEPVRGTAPKPRAGSEPVRATAPKPRAGSEPVRATASTSRPTARSSTASSTRKVSAVRPIRSKG